MMESLSVITSYSIHYTKLYDKEVAENYRGTPEAESALSGIKNCYVEQNNVDEYFAYIRRLGGGATVSATEQDQLTYMAAERLYMDGKAEAGTQP